MKRFRMSDLEIGDRCIIGPHGHQYVYFGEFLVPLDYDCHCPDRTLDIHAVYRTPHASAFLRPYEYSNNDNKVDDWKCVYARQRYGIIAGGTKLLGTVFNSIFEARRWMEHITAITKQNNNRSFQLVALVEHQIETHSPSEEKRV